MIGLQEGSEQKEIRTKDKNIVTVTKITEERIDLTPLEEELERLEAMTEPSNAELLDLAKANHEYYIGRAERIDYLKNRLKELKA